MLAARIELAIILDDPARADALRLALGEIRISAKDKQRYRDDLAVADRARP